MGRATFSGEINPWVAAPDFFDYQERNSVFESLAAYRPSVWRATVRKGDGAEAVPLAETSWNLFPTLRVDPVLGRHFTAAEGERGAPSVGMVSHGYWQRSLGGARDVIGRELPLNIGSEPRSLTIVGVMPEGFRFAYGADIWVPLQRNATPATTVRRFHNWMLLGRLKPGVSLRQAQEQVDGISARLRQEYPDSNRNKALLLTGLHEALAEADRPSLFILMAAVAVLLLAACADVAGLLLSRGAARQVEMAVRSSLGATRSHLVRQLLAETLLLAAAAAGLGLLVAFWLRRLVLRYVPLDSLGVTSLPINTPVLAFALAITLITVALAGLVPAWLGARTNLAADLKSGTRAGETRSRALFRQGLVSVQVAMSVVLLIAAVLLGRSLMQLRGVDPGFRTERLLIAQLSLGGPDYQDPDSRVRFFTGLLDDFRAVPGVTDVTIVNNVPILNPANNIPVWDAAHPPAQSSEAPAACVRFVLPGYFRTMGIPLVAGRDVSPDDAGVMVGQARISSAAATAGHRPPVLVVSRSLGRRLFGDDNPLGRRVGIFTGAAEPTIADVVGVAGDVRMNSLSDEYSLAMYLPYQAAPDGHMRIAVRTTGDPAAVGPALRAALARHDRGLVLDRVHTMEGILGESLQGFSLRAGAVTVFGAAALLLAMLGIYGVLACMVNRRRQDIGLRMVVGATRTDVLRWVVTRGMVPVVVGLVAGLAGAAGAERWLRGQVLELPPADIPTLAGVALCLAVAALAACLLPAWRAMHLDPADALRAE
jgi:putative ABC transport system permease protein